MIPKFIKPLLTTAAFSLCASGHAGTNDPVGIVGLIYSVVVGAVVLFVLATILAVALIVKGNFTFPAVVAVIIFWGWLYQVKIATPIKESANKGSLRGAAVNRCRSEAADIAYTYSVDGVLDEAAALRPRNVLQLLSERRLKFIEFKVQLFDGYAPSIAYPDGDEKTHWKVNKPVGSFVRLELGKTGDVNCASEDELPYSIRGRSRKPPFLPDTCFKLSFSDSSAARYAISYATSETTNLKEINYWQLVDRQENKVMARLSTGDLPNDWVSSGSYLAKATPFSPPPDCGAPHTILASRLIGLDQSQDGHPQLVSLKVVVPSTSPKTLDAEVNNFHKLAPSAQEISASENDYGQIFHTYSDNDWLNTVSQAKKTGWGIYDSQLLDWKNRQLISIQLEHPWFAKASTDGFLVWSTGQDWYGKPDNLLARYAHDGKLTWTASVSGTQPEVLPSLCTMTPRGLNFEAGDVLFYSPCKKVGSVSTVLVWRIKQNSLPVEADLPAKQSR